MKTIIILLAALSFAQAEENKEKYNDPAFATGKWEHDGSYDTGYDNYGVNDTPLYYADYGKKHPCKSTTE